VIADKFQNELEEIIVHTGQYYDPDMSDIFFHELEIPKEKYILEIGFGNHGEQTSNVIFEIVEILLASSL